MALESFAGKKYKLDFSENFEPYMKAVGVSMMVRKVANTLSPVLELTKNGDEFVITSTTSYKTSVVKFKVGVEQQSETADGRTVTSIFTVDGNTIHEVQKDKDGKQSTIERAFSADEVKMVLKVDDIVCTRIYKLQA